MGENQDGWLDTDDIKKHHKKDRPVWAGIPVLLFLVAFILLSGLFGLLALLPLGLAAILLIWFRKRVIRLPRALYFISFVFLGLLLWFFITSGPVIHNPIGTGMKRILSFGSADETIVVSNEDFGSAPGTVRDSSDSKQDSLPPASNDAPSGDATIVVPDTDPAFDNFLNNGLKAVENEEYAAANENFKKAFAANPKHPRLQQLAAEFRKMADEKCTEFKNANAKQLSHIPNNYYQYAASLTQTVPLKCD